MDFGTILLHLAVVLVAARVAAEVAERIHVPVVLAEIVVGLVLGPGLLGWVEHDEFVRNAGELGVLLLLFEVGREMDLSELARVGGAALRVAILGVVVPMAGGYVAMQAVGLEGEQALFIAAGITATSVGLTARVFGDLRMLASTEARTVLGAAVADDVIGLLVLTVVVAVSTGVGVTALEVARISTVAVGFVVAATALGVWLVPRALRFVQTRARTDAALLSIGLAFALGIAYLADLAQLAPIVGAFVAGLAVARADDRDELHRRIAPLGQIFIPIFFVQIGLDIRPSEFASGRVLAIAAALIGVAVAGKLVSGWGISSRRADRLMVGIGMIPRGEVGLIFAGLGLANGVLDQEGPDRIDRILSDRTVETVVEDWEAVHLNAPTNIAFCGPDLGLVVAACVGEEFLAIADLGVKGSQLRRPVVVAR
jgi:Kef-type K+ transport system membrane component KefB